MTEWDGMGRRSMPTNEDETTYWVTLTRGEAQGVEQKAAREGLETADFLAYCIRVLSFGMNHALCMLAKQGQAGTHEDD